MRPDAHLISQPNLWAVSASQTRLEAARSVPNVGARVILALRRDTAMEFGSPPPTFELEPPPPPSTRLLPALMKPAGATWSPFARRVPILGDRSRPNLHSCDARATPSSRLLRLHLNNEHSTSNVLETQLNAHEQWFSPPTTHSLLPDGSLLHDCERHSPGRGNMASGPINIMAMRPIHQLPPNCSCSDLDADDFMYQGSVYPMESILPLRSYQKQLDSIVPGFSLGAYAHEEGSVPPRELFKEKPRRKTTAEDSQLAMQGYTGPVQAIDGCDDLEAVESPSLSHGSRRHAPKNQECAGLDDPTAVSFYCPDEGYGSTSQSSAMSGFAEPSDDHETPAETSSSPVAQIASRSNFNMPSGQQKRKGGPSGSRDDDGQDDEDDGGFKRPRPNASAASPASFHHQMRFACPYQKSDPKSCGNCGQRHRNAEPGFRDFHRVV